MLQLGTLGTAETWPVQGAWDWDSLPASQADPVRSGGAWRIGMTIILRQDYKAIDFSIKISFQ